MRRNLITIIAVIVLIIASASSGFASEFVSRCTGTDTVCKQFEAWTLAEQPEKVIEQYDPAKQYSDASRSYVGDAYLSLASQDNISPELEEAYYWKALKVGHTIAYMGLYFFTVQKDEKKALDYLREYVKTGPADTVPYAILGESELNHKNYALADSYLRQAKKVAHAHSPRIDWLLFQTNYLLKNYEFAAEMFESAATSGKYEKEIKALASDARFEGIGKRPEFKKYQGLLSVPEKSS